MKLFNHHDSWGYLVYEKCDFSHRLPHLLCTLSKYYSSAHRRSLSTSYNASKLALEVSSPFCLQSVIWCSRDFFPYLLARSPDSTPRHPTKLRRSAFRFLPSGVQLPTAAGRAWYSASSSPTRQCEDAPLISLFHPLKLRESRATAWHLTRDGLGIQLKYSNGNMLEE